MALVSITGTINDACGSPVENVVVRLAPAPRDLVSAEAIDGVGLVTREVEVLTDENGEFAINAIVGFRYRLTIEDIHYTADFVAPDAADVRFDLLGLRPFVEDTQVWTPDTEAGADGDPWVRVVLRCNRVDTVRSRYDEVVLERGDGGGVWTTVDEVELVAALSTYAVVDETPGVEYRSRYRRTGSGDVSEWSEVVPVTVDPSVLVISIEELKDVYLFGADLTDDDGTPFPRRMYEVAIRSAVAWLERELDLSITPVEVVDEDHDHYAQDYGQWGWIQCDTWPVSKVRKVSFRYPSMTTEAIYPADYVQLVDGGAHGLIQIVPGRGGLSDVLITPGSILPMFSAQSARIPGVWRVSYRAGWAPEDVPADIKNIVGMVASFGPFNVAGDLIAGAGIASISSSVPGLSQSLGTSSSAMYSGYGSRISDYQKQVKDLLASLKTYYGKSMKMVIA